MTCPLGEGGVLKSPNISVWGFYDGHSTDCDSLLWVHKLLAIHNCLHSFSSTVASWGTPLFIYKWTLRLFLYLGHNEYTCHKHENPIHLNSNFNNMETILRRLLGTIVILCHFMSTPYIMDTHKHMDIKRIPRHYSLLCPLW